MSKFVIALLVVVVCVLVGAVLLWYARSARDAPESKRTSATRMENPASSLTTRAPEAFRDALRAPNTVVLDVRTPEEYAAGHLEGAVNINFYEPDFHTRLETLDKTVPYAVYCHSGGRSGKALERMRELGFTSVMNLQGGIVAWQQAGKTLCDRC